MCIRDSDGTIRVWDADTHAHVATLEGHTGEVYSLTIYKNKLFSGSMTTLFVYGRLIMKVSLEKA